VKLFRFCGVETDLVAADDETSARDFLRRHYGISDDDIALSYEDIAEVDPNEVELVTDEVALETEEPITITAAETMAGKTKPFLVGSTYE
jgi:hypothetical protein